MSLGALADTLLVTVETVRQLLCPDMGLTLFTASH